MKQENEDMELDDKLTNNEEIVQDETSTVEGSEINGDNTSDEDDSLSKELNELKEKHNELNGSFLRLHAEFDNYRKRTLKEKAELIKNGGERVLTEIIPLVDDLERALEQVHLADDKDAFLEGLDLIYNKFENFLNQQGIKEIETTGETFDPERFEAVSLVPAPTKELKGKVIDCIQKGYMLNDKVIRFPKVIVGE
ncbi:MAG: nucleotide exchange factor GrpE [Dysgonamonadaceae bacterium]|nr:nucleotide exchange factor GrpE [Dysgonamonadaceae bacterium]MDD3901017.1 nucleotide exchange factor GrpE [Dysgonamonadaceae bacterium]MDD4399199.1 nucleotide exchange factor GrpE [Dysgonamonadaceae bacterium]